jgi:hypothetical protein
MYDIDTYIKGAKQKAWKEIHEVQDTGVVPRLIDEITPDPPASSEKVGSSGIKPRSNDKVGQKSAAPDADTTTEAKETGKDKSEAERKSLEPELGLELDLPVQSPFHDQREKTVAAFVLNHLSHHGYTETLNSTRSEMARRKWLPVKPTSSSDAVKGGDNVDDEPTATSSVTILQRINELGRAISDKDRPIPLDEIAKFESTEISPSSSSSSSTLLTLAISRKSLLQRFAIHQLMYLIREAQSSVRRLSKSLAPDERAKVKEEMEIAEMRALDYGRQLRKRSKPDSENWGLNELVLLEEAFGVLTLGYVSDVESSVEVEGGVSGRHGETEGGGDAMTRASSKDEVGPAEKRAQLMRAKWDVLRDLDGEVLDAVLRSE